MSEVDVQAENVIANYIESKKKKRKKKRNKKNGHPNGESEFYQIKIACASSMNYLKNNLEEEVEKLIEMQKDVIDNIEHLLKDK